MLTVEIIALWLIGATLLIQQWRHNRSAGAALQGEAKTAHPFLRVFPVAYLAVLAILWCTALPNYTTTPTKARPHSAHRSGVPLHYRLLPARLTVPGRSPRS